VIFDKVERAIASYRRWVVNRAPGPYGDWHRENGVEQFWRDLPATADDVTIDAGGHAGDWTAQMVCRYGSKVLTFEPIREYCDQIRKRFGNNPRVKVFQAGLAGDNGEATFALDGLSTGLFATRETNRSERVKLVDVREVFAEHGLTNVAVMKMNIEGGEYELLERMVEADLLRRVGCFLIQFHACAPDYATRHKRLQSELQKTHRLVFEYPHVWERWDRKAAD
jgi:FkbM family methyltransferase